MLDVRREPWTRSLSPTVRRLTQRSSAERVACLSRAGDDLEHRLCTYLGHDADSAIAVWRSGALPRAAGIGLGAAIADPAASWAVAFTSRFHQRKHHMLPRVRG